MTLQGKTIAILIAPRGTEEPEFTKPRDALLAAGATVTVVGLEAGEAETVNNDP
jgi:protease I